MQILIRLLRSKPDGASELQDTELDADRITIGSAPDRGVQLLGPEMAADHAYIRRTGSFVEIVARSGARIRVNGVERRSSRITSTDIVELGGHRLTLIQAPSGFDLAIQVEPSATFSAEDFESAFRTDLDRTWLSKRAASWILVLMIPLLALTIPLAGAIVKREPARAPVRQAAEPGSMRADLVSLSAKLPHWLPSDAFWSSGDLVPAHAHATAGECSACHKSFFDHIPDTACRQCHQRTQDHFDIHKTKVTGLPDPQRCAQCHKDHDAVNDTLIMRADAFCISCHGNEKVHFDTAGVAPVHGFSKGTHPAFKANLLVPPADASSRSNVTDWSFVRTAVLGAKEQSNLKFSHEQHLSGTAMKQLGCRDCHVLASNGEHFAPVTMAKACSSCHSLTFDESHTERQLPHGNAQAASAMLEDYFIRTAVAPPTAPEFVRRARPDQPKRPVLEKCTDAPLVCGRHNAETTVVGFFTDRGCAECHVVDDSKSADLVNRFDVRQVRLVGDYYGDMRFDHRAHEVMKDRTGDDACAECHGARTSRKTEDLLVPDVDKCLACHEDRRVENKVLTGCVSCHVYHPTDPMRKTEIDGESTSQ